MTAHDTSTESDLVAVIADLRGMLSALQETIKDSNRTIRSLENTVNNLRAENDALKRLIFGQRSERQRKPSTKMPTVAALLATGLSPNDTANTADGKRKKTGGRSTQTPKRDLPEEHITHVPKQCTQCSSARLTDTGVEDLSEEIEFVPARFVRRLHHRKRKRCLVCEQIVHAPPPYRPSPNCAYGIGLHAHVAVSKCADSMPVHRLAQSMTRSGLVINRSTLNDLFHRVAECLAPIHTRLLSLVGQASHVNADETPIRVQTPGKCSTAYMWTFIGDRIVSYTFASSRSGETPKKILGDSPGKLQADAYSGYNAVCVPEGRERGGCMAHVRRKFWEARESGDNVAQEPIDQILKLYRLEYEAAERDILGSPEHGELRRTMGRKFMLDLFVTCRILRGRYPPKSALGKAARYTLNNWRALLALMHDPKMRLDNNIAEGALRIIALGRKNFLFVGNGDGGYSLAVLQTIVATCKLNGVNPYDYIVAVLPALAKIDTTDTRAMDALLPQHWANAAG